MPVEARTKKAGVAIDEWKLDIFKRHLDAAGYKYSEPLSFTPGTLILTVEYEWVKDLQPIIEAAERECRSDPRSKHHAD